ncbi:MAG: FAD-dependent oxidoreductase [Parasporobacterium sp.]|nr:FAD-dependent oxidoreductase [Parasporobacterium sp.]
MHPYKHLFDPIKVGTHTYKNRIISAPIYCGTFVNIPGLNKILFKAMSERAAGGAAQVTVGETAVNFHGASREPFPPINYADLNDPSFPKFAELFASIKAGGAKALIELSHCGESVEPIPGVEYGMGPMGYDRPDGLKIYAMDEAMMQEVTDDFITCAKFMKAAGADGIMIHCGHGWLLHQFLSARINKRDDKYGGSLENRARFPLALLKAVRDAMGADFIIEIRVSGEEAMGDEGMHADETAAFCKMAQEYVDLIHVSVGVYRNPVLSGEFSSMFAPHGLNSEASKVIKAAVNVPVVCVGGIVDPAEADGMIDSQVCDFVALARPLTADPEFPKKAEAGKADDISPCVRCFKCFMGPLEGVDISEMPKLFGCTVNPKAFCIDEEFLTRKAESRKKVLVIGGGVGGMQAAVTAFDQGHDVTLADDKAALGGVMFYTDTDYYKKDLNRYKKTLINRVKARDIKIINKAVSPEDVKNFGADAVIIAIGASPVIPDIKGVFNAKNALGVYAGYKPEGKNIIMLGGGLIGCETAIDLARDGYNVTVVIRGDESRLAKDAYPMHRIGLMDEMERMVNVKTGLQISEILPGKIICTDTSGAVKEIPCDDVLYAFGMKADTETAEALKAAAEAAGAEAFIIGDCVKPGKIYDSNIQGFTAAQAL